MLSPNRTLAWLLVAALALTATRVGAQSYPNEDQLFPPQDLKDMQPFAPADVDNYDGAAEPHQGFFFTYDGLVWAIKSPPRALIGTAEERLVFYGTDAAYDYQYSEADTSPLRTQYKYGNRFEYGYMGRDHGIYGCYFGLQQLNQEYSMSDVDMTINDDPYGIWGESRLQGLVTHINGMTNSFGQPEPGYLVNNTNLVLRNLPLTYTWMDVQNKVSTWGTELLYVRRFRQCNRWFGCGRFELMMGARYLDFEDNFIVRGYGGILDTSYWNTEAFNRIIGPELGGRMWWTRGRWTLETDARFTAGFNRQNFRIQGELGENLKPNGALTVTGLPFAMNATGFADHAYADEFAPIVEGRLNLKYQLTRNVNLKVGGTMIWMDGVARACNSITYTLPSFLVDTSNNNQSVWMAGVNVGIEVNR